MDLPLEIFVRIIELGYFTFSDIKNLLQVSLNLHNITRLYLTKLYGNTSLQPICLEVLPNLISLECPIIITKVKDFEKIIDCVGLKMITLDMTLFFEDFTTTIIWREKQITSITSMLLFFLSKHYHLHKDDLDNTHFTFLLPDYKITYNPGSISLLPQGEPQVTDIALIVRVIEICRVKKYIGPYVEEVGNPSYEEVVLYLDDKSITDCHPSKIVFRLLTTWKEIRHLAIHLKNITPYDLSCNLLYFLYHSNIVLPKIQVLDLPIPMFLLSHLHKVFPNLEEPLLEITPIGDKTILRYFTKYRLLPGVKHPDNLTTAYPCRVDPGEYCSEVTN